MKHTHALIVAVLLSSGSYLFSPIVSAAEEEKEILYWVAPMDANYRRDEAGKSPMGMDLVPVYADGGDAGVVSINPVMVQNLGVRTAVIERGKLWRRIDTVGYVGFDERKISHVHLRTDGWIEKLYVKSNGERVKKGEPLFELYSREMVTAQEEYIQAARSGNPHLRQASHERLRVLGMSPVQIKILQRTQKARQRITVYASQNGIVHALNIREGMYVKPSAELLTLVDLSSVWLLVDVFERQSEWVAVGQATEVSLPYLPGQVFEGKVEFIYPTIDPRTRTLRARLQFDNPNEILKPDMYADVRIYAGPKLDVVIAPRSALIRTGEGERIILALGEGKFRAQAVVAGMESGDWVEIKSGLKPGDKVVTSGQFLIDSEASLRASFSRMGSDDEMPTEESMGSSDKDVAQDVSGMGKVNSVDAKAHKLNITHQPIEVLGWPEMTMDFQLADGVDITAVKVGQQVHFTLKKGEDARYRIEQIKAME